LAACRVLCAKVVGATSSEGFLVNNLKLFLQTVTVLFHITEVWLVDAV